MEDILSSFNEFLNFYFVFPFKCLLLIVCQLNFILLFLIFLIFNIFFKEWRLDSYHKGYKQDLIGNTNNRIKIIVIMRRNIS